MRGGLSRQNRRNGPGEFGKEFEVGGVGEHIEAPDARETIAGSGKAFGITGESRGFAGHV